MSVSVPESRWDTATWSVGSSEVRIIASTSSVYFHDIPPYSSPFYFGARLRAGEVVAARMTSRGFSYALPCYVLPAHPGYPTIADPLDGGTYWVAVPRRSHVPRRGWVTVYAFPGD